MYSPIENPSSNMYIEFLEVDDHSEDECPPEDTFSQQNVTPVSTRVPKGRKRKSRTEYFSSEEKKQLAFEVKSRSQIWDITNADHHNHAAINQAWREIGSLLQRTPDSCKTAWIALRESHRYRKNQKFKKSGSDGGQPLPGTSTSANLDWEFAEDLAFLPDVSRKRKTFTTTEFRSQDPGLAQDAIDVEHERSDAESPRTNYFYQTRPAPKVSSKEDETVIQLADNINQLIEHQKTVTSSAPVEENPIIHKTALANIDRMLQKLPPNIVEDTLFEITVLTYNKLKLYEQ